MRRSDFGWPGRPATRSCAVADRGFRRRGRGGQDGGTYRRPGGGSAVRRGHFTDPDQPACPTCGSPRHPDDRRVTRPRPPVGILVTDGGTIYPVTGDVLIGREPASATDV